MNLLIDLYDNSLIYHPNIFFPVLFLLSILGLILLIAGAIFLNSEFKKIAKEIKVNLKKIKIQKRERIKIYTPKLTINIFYSIKFTWNFIVKIHKILRRFQLSVGKIIMKIKKEVLID